MKINWKKYAKSFEQEQEEYGTEIALKNVLWNLAAEILRATGVKSIKTTYEGRK